MISKTSSYCNLHIGDDYSWVGTYVRYGHVLKPYIMLVLYISSMHIRVCVDASLSHDGYTNTQTRFIIMQNSFVGSCAHGLLLIAMQFFLVYIMTLLIQLNNNFYISNRLTTNKYLVSGI